MAVSLSPSREFRRIVTYSIGTRNIYPTGTSLWTYLTSSH
jgi:hypothetical protein